MVFEFKYLDSIRAKALLSIAFGLALTALEYPLRPSHAGIVVPVLTPYGFPFAWLFFTDSGLSTVVQVIWYGFLADAAFWSLLSFLVLVVMVKRYHFRYQRR
ncbi:MAG TPA: hypothetical protein VJ574_01055 [Candidatus Bathyarchaeia archaeon]|nr:hypothetical protein [Candidatus Bathyarchaeia archaeon]